MPIINKSTIDHHHTQIKEELNSIIPINQWVVKPKRWCLTKAKTKYGMADSNGVIHINHNFLGTNFQQLLQAVLRHEFAHLCVGLMQGHNRRFKQCEQLFNAQFNLIVKQQSEEYSNQVSYKFLLQAELINGQLINLKKAHRRHRNYLHYRMSRYKTYYYQQQAIKRFRYIVIE